ncbi:MAG: hypothetical protein U1E65_05645 [Myxococcota bacterium]
MRRFFENLGASFERLSQREQYMALFVTIAGLGLILGLATFFVQKDLGLRQKRILAKTEKLVELANLRGDYQRRLADQNRLASEIRKNNSVRLLSYIEEVSKHAGINVENAQERPGQATGSDILKEEAAEITVKSVSIDRLYDFLKRVEEGNALVKIRHLKVRKRFDNPKRLDATITVGTFKTTS